MRGNNLYTVLAACLLMPLFGCAQSMDTTSSEFDQISVTGQGEALPPNGTASLLKSGEASALPKPQQEITTPPDALPFVRSKPKMVPPFPVVLNGLVKRYVDDFVAQPAGLERSFRLSRPYLPEMVSLLNDQGLPPDLVYLSFAESGFSSSGAGPWQLNVVTARRYGLLINRWVDERRDPIKSTRAAAEYLATLHDQTGSDWRMTLVAWNNGDSGVERYIGLQDASYESMVTRLPRRTRQLMNRFMAVDLIARNAREYGLEVQPVSYNQPRPYHLIRVKGGMLLSRVARMVHTTIYALRYLNPAILRDRIPPALDSYEMRVPDAQSGWFYSEPF
jgi:peptidoglycan lytic transglycosylase D